MIQNNTCTDDRLKGPAIFSALVSLGHLRVVIILSAPFVREALRLSVRACHMSCVSYVNSNNEERKIAKGDASQVTHPPLAERPSGTEMPSLGWRWPCAVVQQLPLDSQEGYQPAGCCRIHSLPADAWKLGTVRLFVCLFYPAAFLYASLLRTCGPIRASAYTLRLHSGFSSGCVTQKMPIYILNLPHSSEYECKRLDRNLRPPRSTRRATRIRLNRVNPTLLARISCSNFGHAFNSPFSDFLYSPAAPTPA